MGVQAHQSLHSNMRSLIIVLVLSLAMASVLAKKGKGGGGKGKGGKGEKEESKGMCLSEDQMMMMCKAGSELGEKAMAAMEACSNNVETRAKKGKGKGKGNAKCPSVNEIMDWAAEEYAGEICVFSEMGWLDNDFNTNDELIETDIDTLPSEIAESLKGDEYDECVVEAEKKMEKMAKKKMKKCTYSEDEIAQLDDLGTGIAHTECFKYIFKKSCQSYLKNSLADALGGIMTAAGK